MNPFLFSINAILPIILMVATGYLLKRIGWFPTSLVKPLNALIFRVFLPAMLFLNVYKIKSLDQANGLFILYGAGAIVMIFFIGIPLAFLVTREPNRRGVLIMTCFRSNSALIGVALASSLFGEPGVQAASLLSAAVIPINNILAVISLSVFRQEKGGVNIKRTLWDIAKNPLLLSVLAGLVVLWLRGILDQLGSSFRLSDLTPIYKLLEYFSSIATPLALLVLGAQFEFSAVKALKKEILFGTAMRTILVPLAVLGLALILFRNHFSGAEFATLISFFATPAAVASVPMVQEMKGDTVLAGQLVVWTTLVSAFTLFLFIFTFRAIGILV